MFTRTSLLFACIAVIFIIGCSDDTIEIINSDGIINSGQNAVSVYFPVDEGYSTTYSVRRSDGSAAVVRYEAGGTVSFKDMELVEWSNKTIGGSEKNYIRITDDAVYLYESLSSSPEKILQLPLEPGVSWDRFATEPDDDDEDIIIDISTGGSSNKTIPTVGAVTMVVEEIERLELKDGTLYSNTVKISNDNGTSKNFYWFAEGIGLVRYVIAAYDSEGNTGQVVGELISFGF